MRDEGEKSLKVLAAKGSKKLQEMSENGMIGQGIKRRKVGHTNLIQNLVKLRHTVKRRKKRRGVRRKHSKKSKKSLRRRKKTTKKRRNKKTGKKDFLKEFLGHI